MIEALKKTLGDLYDFSKKEKISLYFGRGCRECNNTGYLGRIGIFEVLVVSVKIAQMILTHATSQTIENQAVVEGMVTMKQDGFMKVLEGTTSIEEVLRVAEE